MRRNSGDARTSGIATRPVDAALDELRFGRANTLDLRASLPTGAEAVHRAELFLRERQMASVPEVLVITGRGNQSPNGVPVVRPAVEALLAKLRRRGVVAGWKEHTPGSFVVTSAPITALLEAPRRRRDTETAAVLDHGGLIALDIETRDALRRLAIRSLQMLGVPTTDSFVHDEMLRQFSLLGRTVPSSPDRDELLRSAALAALDELDDAK